MSRKTRFSKTDSKIIQMINDKNLSESRIRTYDVVFDEIYNLYEYTPSKLLEIAKNEQKPSIENGVVITKDLDDRTIYKIQSNYNNYLKNRKINGKPLQNRTRQGKILAYRAFLNHFNIELPKMPEIPIPKDRIRDKDIPSWIDVKKAMDLCKSLRDKSIIAFAVTTGFRVSDIVNFEIGDLIEACNIYFDENEEHTLENLLKKNPDDIVPCWELNPQKTTNHSNLTVTFNTPEASNYIWDYLKDRIRADEKKNPNYTISEDEALFKSQRGKKLSCDTVQDHFRKLNKRLGNKRDKNPTFGKFRLQNLRKLFKTTCRRNISNIQVNSDKTYDGDVISLFTGHITKDNPLNYVYEAVEEDSKDSHIRKVYQALIPYLSIQPTEVKDFKTDEYKKLEERNKELEDKLEKHGIHTQRELEEKDKQIVALQNIIKENHKTTTKKIEEVENKVKDVKIKPFNFEIKKCIDQYYTYSIATNKDDIGLELKTDDYIILTQLAYDLAIENESEFNTSDEYLNKLFRKAVVHYKLYPDIKDEIIKNNINNNLAVSKIAYDVLNKIDNKFFEISKKSKEEIHDKLIEYLVNYKHPISDLSDNRIKKIIEDIIFDSIDSINPEIPSLAGKY